MTIARHVLVAGLALLTCATTAAADSAQLDAARRAIDEVRYDDAQRLLVGALQDGGNSVAAVREIYRLAANTAVVLGQRDVGEQYYRRWIAIDPAAALGPEVAPKLREPFDAARSFVAAHGRLSATMTRRTTTVEVAVIQPLPMASAVKIAGAPDAVSLSAEQRAVVPIVGETAMLIVLDDRGNHLAELPVPAASPDGFDGPVADPVADAAPIVGAAPVATGSRRWLAFAVPSAILLAGGVGFGIAAAYEYDDNNAAYADSGQHFYADVRDRHARTKVFAYVALGSAVVGGVLAIPALYHRSKAPPEQRVIPFFGNGGGGAMVTGRF